MFVCCSQTHSTSNKHYDFVNSTVINILGIIKYTLNYYNFCPNTIYT